MRACLHLTESLCISTSLNEKRAIKSIKQWKSNIPLKSNFPHIWLVVTQPSWKQIERGKTTPSPRQRWEKRKLLGMFTANGITAYSFAFARVHLAIRGSPNIGFQNWCWRLGREDRGFFLSCLPFAIMSLRLLLTEFNRLAEAPIRKGPCVWCTPARPKFPC